MKSASASAHRVVQANLRPLSMSSALPTLSSSARIALENGISIRIDEEPPAAGRDDDLLAKIG